MKTVAAIFKGLCPRCRKAPIFKGFIEMHPSCPACQLTFEREPGYFLGAMMFSYALAILTYGGIYLLLAAFTQQTFRQIFLEMIVLYLPAVPLIFRYSRIIWIYFDRAVDPES